MIVGHEDVWRELAQDLPPVGLLLGPKSVGKWTMALQLGAKHGFLVPYDHLSAGIARQIVDESPIRYARTVVRVVDVDSGTEAAQNILLKVLEEPPPHCRFLLIASRDPLPTVMSRSRIYRMGLLTDQQVARVLQQNGQAGEFEAAMAAARGRGQVGPAAESIADRESARVTSVVAAAVRAAPAGGGALDLALRNWTPEHTVVMRRWAMEAASGRWVFFTEDFAPGVSRDQALRLLYVLGTYEARTAASVALDILKEKK